jgi:hypothetical protein
MTTQSLDQVTDDVEALMAELEPAERFGLQAAVETGAHWLAQREGPSAAHPLRSRGLSPSFLLAHNLGSGVERLPAGCSA